MVPLFSEFKKWPKATVQEGIHVAFPIREALLVLMPRDKTELTDLHSDHLENSIHVGSWIPKGQDMLHILVLPSEYKDETTGVR